MAELIDPGSIIYEAVIKRNADVANSSAWVGFPFDLKETYGKGNLVPVKITFDDRVHYTGSLAKMGGENAMILLRKDVRAQLGKEPGETVSVRVDLDTSERKVNISKDEETALKESGLLNMFRSLAFTHQREYHQWIEAAKRPETHVSRIAKMVEMLRAGKKEPR